MQTILELHEINHSNRSIVGGKGFVLSQMARNDILVPGTFCITTDAYNAFLDITGLRERIMLELYRKDLDDMRWEEIWDASTRIRNLFINTRIPDPLRSDLRQYVKAHFKNQPVVVRSSAIDEDSARASFAGLHASIVNVMGIEAILDAIRRVWASLWSDAAILYRNEIGLDTETSAMAVVVQAMVWGDVSGVAFSRNPNDESQMVVEAVYGLNQGLVDGQVEPDRWIVDRKSRKIVTHTPAQRERRMVPKKDGVASEALPQANRDQPPLTDDNVAVVLQAADALERLFDGPQDLEWTFKDNALYLFQSRPITTTFTDDPADKRTWYLSLHRSFDSLKALRKKIENDLIPEMIKVAARMRAQDLNNLTDEALADEIQRRQAINTEWVNIYWADFIPFAHGIRLFGQVYNDVVRPENPYEFVDLLGQTQMESLARNQLLEDLASMVRQDPELLGRLENMDYLATGDTFIKQLDKFIAKFGDLSCPVTGATQCSQGPDALVKIVLEMAAHPPAKPSAAVEANTATLRKRFFECFEENERPWAEDLLDLARASYRLRDDDNIHLGRIEAQVMAAVQEGQQRVQAAGRASMNDAGIQVLRDALPDTPVADVQPSAAVETRPQTSEFTLKPRQLTGQPAGPGLCKGKARVINQDADLLAFKHGDILVCDAVDPNMTFVVPLAAGIVERRGGMLIHGAIIAREYGLACVTGVPDATALIRTGDSITVDGYLGIVTIG